MSSADVPTNPPTTYDWAAVVGGTTGIVGVIGLTACVVISVMGRSAHGYLPIPSGLTAVSAVLSVAGVVMVLWRVIVAWECKLMERLESIDSKLDNVWGIAATTSIESKPFHPQQQHTQRRGRRRKRSSGEADAADNVTRLPSPRYTNALKRIAKKIADNPEE